MSMTSEDAPQWIAPPRGFARVLDYAASSHRRAVAVLLLFCLVAFLPGFFQIPPVDRDEARFAQATKQMIESGQYVDIRFQNVQRANAIGLRYVLSRHIEGFNISFGRPVVLTVFRSMVR